MTLATTKRAALDLLLDHQGGLCAICRRPPRCATNRHSRLRLDHDHTTGLVRGYLCHGCNYLEAHSTKPAFVLYRAFPPTTRLGLRIRY